MMKKHKQDFALGVTAIAALAAFLGTVIFLYPALRGGGRVIRIQFRHEEGLAPLRPGSLVLLGDSFDVGQVRGVWVEQIKDAKAGGGPARTVFVVEAVIRRDVPLYGNCEITTNQPAIGGSGYVCIQNVGTPDVPLVQPIQGLPPQSLAAMMNTLSRRLLSDGGLLDQLGNMVDPEAETSVLHKLLVSLDDVNAMTREFRFQMTPNEQQALLHKIHLVLDNLNATTAALRSELAAGNDAALLGKVHAALGRLDAGLGEAAAMLKENRPLVHDTLTSVEHTARTLDQEMLVALRKELDPTNPDAILGKLHAAMNRVNESLQNVQTMTAEGERAVVLSRPAIEKTLRNFQDMSEQLRLASQEVLLNPSKLIWGPQREREDKLLVFRAASSFAEAASQLDDAAGRLEAVLKTLPADGAVSSTDRKEIQAIHDAVQAAFQRFGRAEEVLWEQLK